MNSRGDYMSNPDFLCPFLITIMFPLCSYFYTHIVAYPLSHVLSNDMLSVILAQAHLLRRYMNQHQGPSKTGTPKFETDLSHLVRVPKALATICKNQNLV